MDIILLLKGLVHYLINKTTKAKSSFQKSDAVAATILKLYIKDFPTNFPSNSLALISIKRVPDSQKKIVLL